MAVTLSTTQSISTPSRTTTATKPTKFSTEMQPQKETKTIEKEPEGKKSEAWRTRFIKSLKNDYNIIMTMEYSYSQDKNVPVYKITAKKDINLGSLKKELGIPSGVVSNCNEGYGQYDNNGHYIENKAMKDVTIKIPVETLGESIDDRNLLEQLTDWLGF